MKSRHVAKSLATALILAALTACSTAKVRVMPGEDGVNRVVVRDIERDDSEETAVEAAHEYCKDHHKRAVFVEAKDAKYTGSMDEGTRNTVRNASKAATILGSAGAVGSATRTAGGLLGSAGLVGYSMTSDRDYESEIKFKCL